MVYHDPIPATLWDHALEERLRRMRSRFALCLILITAIAASAAQQTTTEPSWAPTGKLSQFRGFATPRINHQLPPNAQFMYASVWAAWSAWSFCSNGVRIRVRACNTVKGFNCLGPNQETRPCETTLFRTGNPEQKFHNDYDVIDPYEADRKEAMKQLYPDDIPENSQENSNFIKLPRDEFRAHSAGLNTHIQSPSHQLIHDQLAEFFEHRPTNRQDGAPGSTPEKVFGARQFTVKSLQPEEQLSLFANAEDITKKNFESKDKVLAELEQKVTPKENAFYLPFLTREGESIQFRSEGLTSVRKNKHKPSLDFDSALVPLPETVIQKLMETHKTEKKSMIQPAKNSTSTSTGSPVQSNNHTDSIASKEVGISKTKHYMIKDTNLIPQNSSMLNILQSGSSAHWKINPSLKPTTTAAPSTTTMPFNSSITASISSSFPEESYKIKSSSDFKHFENSRKSLEEQEKQLAEAIIEAFEPQASEDRLNIIDHGMENVSDESSDLHFSSVMKEEHLNKIGTNPIIVHLKPPTVEFDENAIDDIPEKVEPTLSPIEDVTEQNIHQENSSQSTATESMPTTSEPFTSPTSQIPETLTTIFDELSLMETDNINLLEMKSEGNGVIKQVSPAIMKTQMKTKGFGYTGFDTNKLHSSANFNLKSQERVHDGEVTKETTKLASLLREGNNHELSTDTLDALDWMLNNITKMAEKGDMSFMQEQNRAEGRSGSISNKQENNLMSTEFFAAPLVVVDEETNDPEHEIERSNKTKEWKKTSKGKKSRKHKKKERLEQKLHSGEFVPGKQNHKKFPKFRSRQIVSVPTQAFGVRTLEINEGNEENLDQSKKPIEHSATGSQEFFKDSRIPEDPLLLIEEIAKLQSIMSDMGEKIDTIGSVKTSTTVQPVTDTPYSYPIQIEKTFKKDKNINQKIYQQESDKPHSQNLSRPSAMDLSLVPQEIDFKSDGESRKMYEEADQLHIVSDNGNSDKAAWWTKWSSWGECFCGTQVRTRVCIYKEGSQSDGCSGSSHEVQKCDGGSCPTTTTISMNEVTTPFTRSPSMENSLSHDPRRSFRPHGLNIAMPLS